MVSVKAVTKKKYFGNVYDICVKDDHNYTIENCIVHNSGAGSIVNYLIGITNVNPLNYNLLFSRYLNIARKDYPDIDSDVSNREACVNVIKQMFPNNEITVIINKNRMQIKKLMKSIFKVYEINYPNQNGTYIENSDFCSKLIETYTVETIDDFFALGELEGLEQFCFENLKLDIKEIFELLYNNIDSLGIHAGGVCILPKDQGNVSYTPVKSDSYDYATAYSESGGLTELEQVGEIKFDFLGLGTLSLIENTLKTISKINDIPFSELYQDIAKMKKVDLNDRKVYDLIATLQIEGMFQIGSKGMIEFVKLIKPDNIEELCMLIALYRPGPMSSGMQMKVKAVKFNESDYLEIWNTKSDGTKVDYSDIIKEFADIIKPTYYSVIYEEQVMQIGQRIAKYNDSELNNFRKFLKGAGKVSVDDERRVRFHGAFMENGLKSGYKKDVLDDLWEKLVNFSAYSFNKCLGGDTMVITPNGQKNIKDFEEGDVVISYDQKRNDIYETKVKQLHKNGVKKIYEIQTDSGQTIKCTLNHKFLTKMGMKSLEEILDKNLEVISV